MSGDEAAGGSRTERKKEKTRRKIISVAMNLFQEQGFDATTMEQIAREVDIAKGTLYHYFPVKEAIIDQYIKEAFKASSGERIRGLQELPDTRSRMTALFTQLIEGVQRGQEFFEKYLVYRMRNMVSFDQDDSMKSGFYLLALEIIRLGQEAGEIRRDLPLYTLEDQLEMAFVAVVKQLYLEPEKFNPRQSIEGCVDLFLHGTRPKN